MFHKKQKSISSLSYYQSEFAEHGQKNMLMQEVPSSDKDGDGVPKSKSLFDNIKAQIEVLQKHTQVQMEADRMQAIAADTSVRQADPTIIAAQLNASAAKEQTDPFELDANELVAVGVITKRNLVSQEGSQAFEEAVNGKDGEAIKDLQTLQKSLKADGKYKGSIDENFGKGSKAGVEAIIGENAQAINSFYEAKERLSQNSTKVQSTPAIEKEAEHIQKQ